jgi:hypothetical protein
VSDMKLWLLIRKQGRPVYDVCNGFVIRAETEERARTIASQNCGDEGPVAWLESAVSSCAEIQKGECEGVVLMDFNAG